MVAFLFLSYFDTSYLRTKDTRLSAINIRVPGEPGNEARLDSGLEYGLNFGLDFGLHSIMYELTFVLELSQRLDSCTLF